MEEEATALHVQVGGSHYKKGIQPFQLSLANGHDGCIHAIQKYLTRHARVEPSEAYESLSKAHHICMIRVECIELYGPITPRDPQIDIGLYVSANELDMKTGNTVRIVESWHNHPECDHLLRANAIRASIRDVAATFYPQFYTRKDFTA